MSAFLEKKLKDKYEKAEEDLINLQTKLDNAEEIYIAALMNNEKQNKLAALQYSTESIRAKLVRITEISQDCQRKLINMGI